jgi:hypothetical protein
MANNEIIALSTKKMAYETPWTSPSSHMWSKNAFQFTSSTKRQGHVLMIKFGKSRKIGLSGFAFRNIWFLQVQKRTKAGAKLDDLKIQGCFEAWKMRKKHQGAKIKEI